MPSSRKAPGWINLLWARKWFNLITSEDLSREDIIRDFTKFAVVAEREINQRWGKKPTVRANKEYARFLRRVRR